VSDPHGEDRFASRLRELEALLGRSGGAPGATGGQVDQPQQAALSQLRAAVAELRVRQEEIDRLLAGQQSLRRRHESMLGTLPVAVFVTGVDGLVRWTNAAATALGGPAADDLVGRSAVEMFSAGTGQVLQHITSAEHEDGASFRVRVALRRGEPVDVAVTVSAVPGHETQLSWVVLEERHENAEPSDRGDLPSVLARLALLPSSTDDLVDLLDAAAELTKEVLGPEVALTVTYGSPEDPTILSSTDAVAQQIDGLQLRIGEGPCVDAFASGHTVVTELARTDPRWPALADVIPESVGAIVSVPLRAAGTRVGALNIYCSTPGTDPARVLTAEVLASTIGAIVQEQALKTELHGAAADLQKAMTSRAVIDQAKGIVMAERGCGADEAFAHLGRIASQRKMKVREVAADLVDRRTGSA